jgi:hypothetical protein
MLETEIYEKFIEGELTPESEKKFMARLTLNDELRTNFRHYLVMTNSIRNYVENDNLPLEVSNSIFTALGFSTITNNTDKIKKDKSSFFRSRFFTALVTGLFTFIIAYFIFKPNDSLVEMKKEDESILTQKNEIPLVKIDKNENYKSEKSEKSTKAEKSSINKLIPENEFDNNNSILPKNQLAFEEISPCQVSFNKQSNNSIQSLRNFEFTNMKIKPFPEYSATKYDTLTFYRSYDSKYRFEFKNTPSWFSSSPIVQPNRLNNFNNLSISLYYPVTKTILLGAEFRQETFYINYDDKEKSGQDFTFFMQPNISTYGLLIRYLPLDICCRIKPYGQIEIGGNSTGLVSREMLGLECHLFENAYLTIGGEINQFYYHHLNKWYTSSKYNINYGLGLKF